MAEYLETYTGKAEQRLRVTDRRRMCVWRGGNRGRET